jgi:hypothetical protein
MWPAAKVSIPTRYILAMFTCFGYRRPMPDPADKLTPADPSDLVGALAYALRYQGRKRVHTADAIMAEIVAARLVEHLERPGFVGRRRSAPPRLGAVSERTSETAPFIRLSAM